MEAPWNLERRPGLQERTRLIEEAFKTTWTTRCSVEVDGLSRAAAKHASGVSLFRETVRLSGRQKCHSVMRSWYQMMTA